MVAGDVMRRWTGGLLLVLALMLTGSAATFAADRLPVEIGRALFKRAWVPAPSSTRANDGLGPLFNARSCLSCHQGLDRAPVELSGDGTVESGHLVLRFSDRCGRPDPVYGIQLQTSAVPGHRPEGRVARGDDGFAPVQLAYGPVAAATRVGARAAPMLRGLGWLEDVPEAAILALEDPDDRDGDGVRGRANRLPDGRIGRFGWKASAATVADQVDVAFRLDLGMSTARHPEPEGDCTPAQELCRQGPHGGRDGSRGSGAASEIRPEIAAMLTAYLASIPPPDSTSPPEGGDVFAAAGCAACHRPALPARGGAVVHAFTDLLLHDMGPDLDGGATEPGVAPTVWRTAPLWGLSRTLRRGGGLMHDGRAKTVEEAIVWHGGEAAGARARFMMLSPAEKQRLIAYVGGL